jgi:multiple sugar transport system substrate-binding protein
MKSALCKGRGELMSWKRFFTATFIAFFMLAFAVVAVQAAPLRLTVRTVPVVAAQKFLKTIPKKFKKATGIDLKIEFIASRELRRRLITAAETKSGPDLLMVVYNGAITVKESLADVSEVVGPLSKENGGFYNMYKDGGFIDGKWLAAPFMTTSQVMNYRRENPPDTWEDALRIGKKLKKAKLAPWAESLGTHVIDPSTTILCILWGYGMRQVSNDGKKITLDSAGTRAGLRFIKKAYKEAWPKGVIQWKTLENNQTFLAGKTGMTINSPSIWWKSSTKKKWANLYKNVGFSLVPKGPAGRHCTAIPQYLVLFKYSKKKKEAKEFIKFMAQADMQVGFSKRAWMWTPTQKGLASRLPQNEYYDIMAKQALYAHVPGWPGPASKAGSEVHQRFNLLAMVQRYVQGTQSIDETIKQTVKELRKIYGVN